MVCPKCKSQIPDDAQSCSYCGEAIDHKKQVVKEIKTRRYQRWIMYAIIFLIIAFMIMVIVMIYNRNTDLVNSITQTQSELEKARQESQLKQEALEKAQDNLSSKEGEIKKYVAELSQKDQEIIDKTTEYKQVLDEKAQMDQNYEECQLNLETANANIYSLIIRLGVGASNEDLSKILLADANLAGGIDGDGDGLPDSLEPALGTDPTKFDTDDDGFGDKQELISGYNPNGEGQILIDNTFAESIKGKILLQVEGEGEAWYVSPSDGRKYYLGKPADAFKLMRDIDYWTREYLSE